MQAGARPTALHGAEPLFWCAICSMSATRRDVGLVHGADSHKATVTDVPPHMAEVAARVMKKYSQFVVTVHFRRFYRAAWRGSNSPVHVEGAVSTDRSNLGPVNSRNPEAAAPRTLLLAS